jgi:hypothetical protein
MKLKAYDRYNKQWIYIILGEEDEMHHTENYSNSNGVFHEQLILFQAVEGDKDSCSPKRWSDLEKIELVKKDYGRY